MKRNRIILTTGAAVTALMLAACGGSSDSDSAAEAPQEDAASSEEAVEEAPEEEPADDSSSDDSGADDAADSGASDVPPWCGPNEITLGFADGFGGNNWRLVTTETGRREAAKCPSVKELIYTDGQGDLQKSISDIQGLVSQGADAVVVFPDASEAILPTLQESYGAGVVTVPYRVYPGGSDGEDYTAYIALDATNDGANYCAWIKKARPDGATVLVTSGPKGNSQGTDMATELRACLGAEGDKYTFVGEDPFEVTNWDPAETQKVITAAVAKYPEIDVIASDFGPSLVGALPEFTKAGRPIPALATSDGNILGCFWQDQQDAGNGFDMMTVATGNDHARTAIDYAVAVATGGEIPSSTAHQHALFEDSLDPDRPVQCDTSLPDYVFHSAELITAQEQAALLE